MSNETIDRKPAADRILVADDDESILFLLSKTLERSGYQVVTAKDGLEGLEKLKNDGPFSILLTDLLMPRLGGMELLRQARQMDAYLEIIVITAAGSIESAITAMRDGQAFDYLLKPLDSIKQLSVIVDRAANHRRLVMERAALQQRTSMEAARLKTLLANLNEAILAASTEGIITVANPAAERLVGSSAAPADLVGEPAASALPAKLTTALENWQVIGGGSPVSLEILWNEALTLMVSLNQLPENQGWVMVLRDITALRRVEQLKTQAIAEAVSRIRLPLAEAMSAVVALNQRAQQDESLSGNLFRLTQVWERIQSWGDEMLALVQDSSEKKAQLNKVNPDPILQALPSENTVKRYLQGGGRLNLQVPTTLPPVRTDAGLLTRLLQNLVKRAVLRSPANGEVRILAREYKGQVWIGISDDGPSAVDDDLMQSFDRSILDLPLGQTKVSLDLARAKAILDRLDGQLWVGGGPGPRGSALIVCLPAVTA